MSEVRNPTGVAKSIDLSALEFRLAILFVALALSICLQFAFGAKRMPLGLLNFLAIVFLLYLGYRCIRLQRLVHIFETDLEAMVSLTFGFFVLSQLVSLLNSTAGRILSLVDTYPFFDIPTMARSVSISCLQVVFGFSLFKLASPIFDGRRLGTGNLKFILICLFTQGIGGIISIIGFISDWHLSGFTPYPLMNMSLLVGWVGGLAQEIAFLVLAVDVFLKRSIRRRAGYATLLSMGTAWLLSWLSVLLMNVVSLRVYDMIWNPPGTVASALPMILSSFLTIIVSFSLVRGAKLEGKIMKLSSVAVFLFVGGWLLAVPYLIYDCSLRIIAEPSLILDPRVFTIPTGLASLPYNISLLTVGLLLYRRSSFHDRSTN